MPRYIRIANPTLPLPRLSEDVPIYLPEVQFSCGVSPAYIEVTNDNDATTILFTPGATEVTEEEFKSVVGRKTRLSRSIVSSNLADSPNATTGTRPLTIVLGFHHGDADMASDLLKWIEQLGPYKSHRILLVSNASCTAEDDSKVIASANSAFGKVDFVKQDKRLNLGWPGEANALIGIAMRYVYMYIKTPWLWLEPDAVPLKPQWLDLLQKEYLAAGKPYMGALQKMFLAGVAIYPWDAILDFTQHISSTVAAWDQLGGSVIVSKSRITDLIQHDWGSAPDNAPTFTDLSRINPKAVLFHRCKDGSLIRILREHILEWSIVQLGRIGDLLNILPVAKSISDKTRSKINIIVHKDYAHVLARSSYVNPVLFDGSIDDVDAAVAQAKGMVLVPQLFSKNGLKQITTGSWQREQYKLCGVLDQFNKTPIHLDIRDFDLEQKAFEKVISKHEASIPIICANFTSYSSPFSSGCEYIRAIEDATGLPVVDLGTLKVEPYVDLLGLLDRADLVVTVDTSTLHLLQATHTPYIAILNTEWRQSVPRRPPVKRFWYNNATKDEVAKLVSKCLRARNWSAAKTVVVVMDRPDVNDDRIKEARNQLLAIAKQNLAEIVLCDKWPRVAYNRPYLLDALRAGLDAARSSKRAAIIYINDDIQLDPRAIEYVNMKLRYVPVVTGHRREVPGATPVPHMGRDLIAVRSDWLASHIERIPDFVLGGPQWDLWFVRLARTLAGIKEDKPDYFAVFPECELPIGLVKHRAHQSSWTGPECAELRSLNEKLAEKHSDFSCFMSLR